MKKRLMFAGLIGIIIICVSLLSVSGNLFDSVRTKTFDSSKMEITIQENINGIPIENIAKIKLLTPPINYVMMGKNVKVAEMEIDLIKDEYLFPFNNMEFYNNRDNSKINRNFIYKYKTLEPYEIDEPNTYKKVCEDVIINNQTLETQKVCIDEPDTYKKVIKYKEKWNNLDTSKLTKGKTIVGIFTDVYPEDNVEWIPTLFSMPIEEFATWKESFNNGLVAYYQMEDNNSLLDNIFPYYNFTINGSINQTTGKIGNANNFSIDSNEYMLNAGVDGDLRGLNGNTITITAWVFHTGTKNFPTIIAKSIDNYGAPAFGFTGGQNNDNKAAFVSIIGGWKSSDVTYPQSKWAFLAVTCNTGSGTLYINGTASGTFACDWTNQVGAGRMKFGSMEGLSNFDGSIDEVGVWNRSLSSDDILTLYNNGIGITWESINMSIFLHTPAASYTNLTNNSVSFNCSGNTTSGAKLLNLTLMINGEYNYSVYNFTANQNNLSLLVNYTLPDGNYNWTCNLSDGNVYISETARTISIDVTTPIVNNMSYSNNTYETMSEFFVINVSRMSNATFVYNGTEYPMQISGEIANVTITVPLIQGNKSFYFKINNGTYNTTVSNQSVSEIYLAICNATNNINYINISFRNETTLQEYVNSTLNGFIGYYLGNGTINKSLTILNLTENPSYQLCFTPNDKTIRLVGSNFTYSNSYSPSRSYIFNTGNYSNATTNITLWLLPTSIGQYVTFQILNGANQPLAGATVNMSRTGYGDLIQTSDVAGSALFFVNPLVTYTITVNLTGYSIYTASLMPSQTAYTISLGDSTTITSGYSRGITYSVSPLTSADIRNRTAYSFNFTISSTYWNLDSWGFTIGNGTDVYSTQNSTATPGGTLNYTLNTWDNRTIVMNYYWVINNTYQNGTAVWSVSSSDGTEFSIWNFLTDFKLYVGQGIFGLTSFSFALIIYIIIFFIVGMAAYKFGVTSPATIAGILFAVVALFDAGLGLIPTPGGNYTYVATFITGIIFFALTMREMSQ